MVNQQQLKQNTFMTDKLLITAGCSNTDQNTYDEMNFDVTAWPKIVADELNMEYLNIGMKGASNELIANRVIDTVLDNEDKDLTVMVLWTGPSRLNIFDHMQYVFKVLRSKHESFESKLKDYFDDHYDHSWDLHVMNYNLRCIWKLNQFLKQRNIRYIQAHAFSVYLNILYMGKHKCDDELSSEDKRKLKVREGVLIDSIEKNKYFDKSFFTTQSWLHNMKWIEHDEMRVPGDGHPNQKGQDWIANAFIQLAYSNKVFGEGSTKIEEFVYD